MLYAADPREELAAEQREEWLALAKSPPKQYLRYNYSTSYAGYYIDDSQIIIRLKTAPNAFFFLRHIKNIDASFSKRTWVLTFNVFWNEL